MNAIDEIEDWHARRLAKLRSTEGWLAITGRWEIGEDAVDLPIGVAVAEGRGVRIDGTYHAAGTQFADGARRWEVSHVGGGLVVRVRDPESAALKAFRTIPRFPVDLSYRVAARIVPATARAKLVYASGVEVEKETPGQLAFELHGTSYTLSASTEGSKLFVLFADATNGETTYGAGRFLYVALTGKEVVTLDFNQAFNPPCALTEHATCPLVPDENRLPIPILAGEKYPPS